MTEAGFIQILILVNKEGVVGTYSHEDPDKAVNKKIAPKKFLGAFVCVRT